MKKAILAMVVALIMCFSMTACGGGNPEVEAAIDGKTFYCNGGTVNNTYAITFEGGTANLLEQYVDGNGVHDAATDSASYSIDEENITISWSAIDEMVIPFVLDGTNITLGDGAYRTAEQVKNDIQGIWKCRKSDYVLGMVTENEFNLKINGDSAVYQNAAAAFGGAPGEYYYYGPYNCSYAIENCTVVLSGEDDETFFFTIETEGTNKNKAKLFTYDNEFSRTDKFPGVNDYKF